MSDIQIRKRFNHRCEKCNFNATRPAEWLIHIETKKHKRNGEPKSKICNICNKEFTSHWICKMHILKIHNTKEERSKCEYYCDTCDYIFFSKVYLDKHINGIVHMNLVKALNSINT